MKYIRVIEKIPYPSNVASHKFDVDERLIISQDVYMYETPKKKNDRHWYVNFAD